MPTGSDLFVDALRRLQIGEVFTLVGDHLNEVLAAAGRAGIRIIDFRHESGVTHAADAWARIHRRPAVSLVTGGPGHTNSLTGIATAQLACSPLIAVSGAPAQALAGRPGFQAIDQVGMAKPVVKWAAEAASAAQIPYLLGRAYSEASAGRMGAVHLTIPVDAFAGSCEAPLPMPLPVAAPAPPPAAGIEEALALLRSAARPVVIAGTGVWWSDAGVELDRFLRATNLPCYTVTMARGIPPDTHPLVMGFADPALNRAVHHAFREADVCLVIGKRIDYRLALGGPRLFSPETKFIQVDLHQQELGANRALEVGICADAKAALAAFLAALGRDTWKPLPWLDRLRAWRAEWRAELDKRATDRSAPIHPAAFWNEYVQAAPAGTLYSWDGGDFAHWGRCIVPATQPGGWLRLGPLATIGSALPNAIALQLAHPDQPVAMVTGDGALGFYIAELDTLVRHNLPVVIIVGNDAGWGLERELQSATTGTPVVACELRHTRYDLIMKGFGGEGENLEAIEEVQPALRRAFAAKRPYLLNVNIRGARSPFTEWQIAGKKR